MIVQTEPLEVRSLTLHAHTVLCREALGCQAHLDHKTVHILSTKSGRLHLSRQTVPRHESFLVHCWQTFERIDLGSWEMKPYYIQLLNRILSA